MYILTPLTITEDMIGSGTTVLEPAPGETLWVSGAAYQVDDFRIRPTTHRVYKCVKAVPAGRTVAPESDPLYWNDYGPTQRHAPFDWYVSTAAESTGSLTYVLSPGFTRDLALYGLVGNAIEITVRDAPGGTVLRHIQQSLYQDAIGLYEYLFMPADPLEELLVTNLPLRPLVEITITITGVRVGVGMICCGHFVGVHDGGGIGGTEWGSAAHATTSSYIKSDGVTTVIRKRGSGINLDLTVSVDTSVAHLALRRCKAVIDVPVAIVALKDGGLGMNTFGLVRASLRPGPKKSRIEAKVQGMYSS